jgi:hypothetical protein
VLNEAIPLFVKVAFSPLISPSVISMPSPALIAALALAFVKYKLPSASARSPVSKVIEPPTGTSVELIVIPPCKAVFGIVAESRVVIMRPKPIDPSLLVASQ